MNRLKTTKGRRLSDWREGPRGQLRSPLRRREAAGWPARFGTIFFSLCNLRCQFCQNYDISQSGDGSEVEPPALAADDARTAVAEVSQHQPREPLARGAPGLGSPLDRRRGTASTFPSCTTPAATTAMPALRLLDGIVDIYMPDMKYADEIRGTSLFQGPELPGCQPGCGEGDAPSGRGSSSLTTTGSPRRGLLVRHLVMPGGIAGTAEIARFLAEKISPHTYVNLMDQYRPAYRAPSLPVIDRKPSDAEYADALRMAREAGLCRFDH